MPVVCLFVDVGILLICGSGRETREQRGHKNQSPIWLERA